MNSDHFHLYFNFNFLLISITIRSIFFTTQIKVNKNKIHSINYQLFFINLSHPIFLFNFIKLNFNFSSFLLLLLLNFLNLKFIHLLKLNALNFLGAMAHLHEVSKNLIHFTVIQAYIIVCDPIKNDFNYSIIYINFF